MGANAVTTVPVYTAGEVLTAADLNITNSGIPVFATTTTRDAAFGGAGEKTLAEGQFAYIEATDALQYYNGSAWTAASAGGMTLLSTTTLSGASTAITGISQDYVNLFITAEKWYASSAAYLNMYWNGDSTAGNYRSTCIRSRVGSGGAISDNTFQITGFSEGPGQHNNLVVVNIPYYTSSSYKTWEMYGFLDTDNGQKATYIGSGSYWGATTAISSLTFAPDAGTFSAGTVKIYGVK
jgi:hypothetical protein